MSDLQKEMLTLSSSMSVTPNMFFIKCNHAASDSRLKSHVSALSTHLPACICHVAPRVRPAVVINCVVLDRFLKIIPAVKAWVWGPTLWHPPSSAMFKQTDERQRVHLLKRRGGDFVGAYSAHRISLFSRRPSSRHFYSRCALQQPNGADVPFAVARGGDYDCHKTALARSLWCICGEKQ